MSVSIDQIVQSLMEKLADVAPLLSAQKRDKITGELNTPKGFWTVQPEIEWAWFLLRANVQGVVIEPRFPSSGPDIEARLVARPVHFEVKAPWGTKRDYEKIISYDQTCFAAFKNCGAAASFHVHLSSEFDARDTSAFQREIVRLASRVDTTPDAVTLVYQRNKRPLMMEHLWAPMSLIDNRFPYDETWIRTNYYWLTPAATWPTWMEPFSDSKYTPAQTHPTALFSIENIGMHSPPIRNACVGITREDRKERWTHIRDKLKKTKRQQADSPFVIIFDCSHLPNVTEFDIVTAAFGEEYCRSLLLYAFRLESGINSTSVICPKHISAMIIYFGPHFRTARLYRNPRARLALSQEEVDVLRSSLPCKVECEEDGYGSYEQKMRLTLPDREMDDRAKRRWLAGLVDQPMLHFINKEKIDPASSVTFAANPGWNTPLEEAAINQALRSSIRR